MNTVRKVVIAFLLVCAYSPGASAQLALAPHFELADLVLVEKSERKLHLLKNGRVLRSFPISLGLAPEGHKEREGDFRTPEGRYRLTSRNKDSDYFLSILVSYPNERDRAHARSLGVNPGGAIMIHGTPNSPRYDDRRYQGWDWTDGCIAVSNSDMVDIWLMTREGTPIEIRP
jgi:murein L,D-transpeptidase YafK